MPDQLKWTCPACGLDAAVRSSRVYCACGAVVDNGQLLEVRLVWTRRASETASEDTLQLRLAVCHECSQYKGCRCVLIAFGCSSSYARHVRRAAAQCPLGKWNGYPVKQPVAAAPSPPAAPPPTG